LRIPRFGVACVTGIILMTQLALQYERHRSKAPVRMRKRSRRGSGWQNLGTHVVHHYKRVGKPEIPAWQRLHNRILFRNTLFLALNNVCDGFFHAAQINKNLQLLLFTRCSKARSTIAEGLHFVP
jgi:hypothetical protein